MSYIVIDVKASTPRQAAAILSSEINVMIAKGYSPIGGVSSCVKNIDGSDYIVLFQGMMS